MKKEFKAPIVKSKNLSVQEDVMTGIMSISAEANVKLTGWTDDAETAKQFNIWKGYGQ